MLSKLQTLIPFDQNRDLNITKRFTRTSFSTFDSVESQHNETIYIPPWCALLQDFTWVRNESDQCYLTHSKPTRRVKEGIFDRQWCQNCKHSSYSSGFWCVPYSFQRALSSHSRKTTGTMDDGTWERWLLKQISAGGSLLKSGFPPASFLPSLSLLPSLFSPLILFKTLFFVPPYCCIKANR